MSQWQQRIIILGLILYLIYSKLLRNRIKYWGDKRYYHAGILTKHVTQGFGIIKILKLMSLEKYFLISLMSTIQRSLILKTTKLLLDYR